jgi:hypothetical protein
MSQNNVEFQVVRVMSHGGIIERVLVEDLGDVVTVCTEGEYKRALAEGRTPRAAGFKLDSVVEFKVDRGVITKHNSQYESVAEGEADSGGLGPR